MGKMKLLLFVMLAAFLTASTGFAAETSFTTVMGPGYEVTRHKTPASGTATFKLSKDGKELSYQLRVKKILNANATNIHRGKIGINGPPLVELFTGARKGTFSGMLAEGVITDKDLLGDLQGKTLADLVQVMRSGEAYVNVYTDAFADGEIRGQIQ